MNYQFYLKIIINTNNPYILINEKNDKDFIKTQLNNPNLKLFTIKNDVKSYCFNDENSDKKLEVIFNFVFESIKTNNHVFDVDFLKSIFPDVSFYNMLQYGNDKNDIKTANIEIINHRIINDKTDLFTFLNSLISFYTSDIDTVLRNKDGDVLYVITNNMEEYVIKFVLNILKTYSEIKDVSLVEQTGGGSNNVLQKYNFFILKNINRYINENDKLNEKSLLELVLKFASKYLGAEFLYNMLSNEIFFFRKNQYHSSYYKSPKLIYGSNSLIIASDLDTKKGLVINRDLSISFCNEYHSFLKDISKYFFSQQNNDVINIGLSLNEYEDKYKLSFAKFFLEYDRLFSNNLNNENKYNYNIILSQNNKDYIIITYKGCNNNYNDILNEVVNDFYDAVLKTLNISQENKLLIVHDEKDFLSILENNFDDIVIYRNPEFSKYKFVKLNNDILFDNLSIIKSSHEYYYFVDKTNNEIIEFKNYFNIIGSISKKFSNLNKSQQSKLLRKFLNYEDIVFIDNNIYDVLNLASKKFNLKNNHSFKSFGKLYSSNVQGKYIHVNGENFTYYSTVLSEDDFSKSYIKVFDNPNITPDKVNKKEDVKLGKFLEMFFTFENSKQLDDVIQFITRPSSIISAFSSDKIYKIYNDTKQNFTSCMRNKSTMKFLKDEKRVKVLVIHNSLFDEDLISGEIFGRALLWEEKDWVLLDTLYCKDSHKNEYSKMLQNYVFSLSKKLNKKVLYIRTNRDTLYKVNINKDNIKHKIDNSADKLLIKDVNFDYNSYKKSGDTFYLDTFYFYDTENKILSNCEISNSNHIVKIRRT